MDYANDTQWIEWVQAGIQHVIANAGTQAPTKAKQLPAVTSHTSMTHQRHQLELKVVRDLQRELKAVQALDPRCSNIDQVPQVLPHPLVEALTPATRDIPVPVPMIFADLPPLAECPEEMHPSVARRQQREFKAVEDLGCPSSHSSMEVPPSQLDQRAKSFQQASVRAIKLSNKRTAIVSSNRVENGLELFSIELQQSQPIPELGNDDGDKHLTPTTAKKQRAEHQPATVQTTMPIVSPEGNIRLTSKTAKKRKAAIRPKKVPAPVPIPPPSVPQLKSQGCVHCDLLDLEAMEPSYVPTYLKVNAFLATATCAGDCQMALHDIYAASPREIIHYCDIGKKGFYAPEDDMIKSSMECGLVLCLPCFETRRLEYEKETGAAKGGRRIGRRSNKR